METRHYFEHRARAELAAAEKASCPEARRVHQELAKSYADLLLKMTAEPDKKPHLSVAPQRP